MGPTSGRYSTPSLSKRSVDGATKELQDHLGLDANQVPLALLTRSWPDSDKLETRAVTPAPGDVGQEQETIVPYVFPMSAAAFPGCEHADRRGRREGLPGPDCRALGRNTSRERGTGGDHGRVLRGRAEPWEATGVVLLLSGRPCAVSLAWMRPFGSNLSDRTERRAGQGHPERYRRPIHWYQPCQQRRHYRRHLRFLLVNHLVWNQIDGRYAAMASDLAMVVGAATLKDLGQTYRNTSVDRCGPGPGHGADPAGVRVSAHVPAPASNRQDAVIRPGMSMTAVAPVWEGVTIIPDEVTKAGNGQIVITAVMLFAMKVLRTGAGLVKQGTDHS